MSSGPVLFTAAVIGVTVLACAAVTVALGHAMSRIHQVDDLLGFDYIDDEYEELLDEQRDKGDKDGV
jgi:hypothetical protein